MPYKWSVNCHSFLCRLQLVSRHVIEIRRFVSKSLLRSSGEWSAFIELQLAILLHALNPDYTKLSMPFQVLVTLAIFFLGLHLAVTKINIQKGQKQDVENIKQYRDGTPKSMQTRQDDIMKVNLQSLYLFTLQLQTNVKMMQG